MCKVLSPDLKHQQSIEIDCSQVSVTLVQVCILLHILLILPLYLTMRQGGGGPITPPPLVNV